jgi:hypothetical protein
MSFTAFLNRAAKKIAEENPETQEEIYAILAQAFALPQPKSKPTKGKGGKAVPKKGKGKKSEASETSEASDSADSTAASTLKGKKGKGGKSKSASASSTEEKSSKGKKGRSSKSASSSASSEEEGEPKKNSHGNMELNGYVYIKEALEARSKEEDWVVVGKQKDSGKGLESVAQLGQSDVQKMRKEKIKVLNVTRAKKLKSVNEDLYKKLDDAGLLP